MVVIGMGILPTAVPFFFFFFAFLLFSSLPLPPTLLPLVGGCE